MPLIGHGGVLEYLRASHKRGRLAHAYLLVGPASVGKTTLAREFAALLLNSQGSLETHPDAFIVERGRDPKTGKLRGGIVLEQVQTLCGKLAMGAFLSGWKVCIMDGADLLGTEAANALLKSLEEPRPKTMLLLTAESADGVMPTIRSRCQVLPVNRVSAAAIAAGLEACGVPADRGRLLARLADGRPGLALTYARDPEALERMEAHRAAVLGLFEVRVAERWRLLDGLLPAKLPFQETVDRGYDILGMAGELLRDALLAACGRGDTVVHDDVAGRTAAVGRRLGPKGVVSAGHALVESRRMLGENVNPRAALDAFALSF
jgi:DNA polymerase-3 subunit delta'